MGSLFHLLWFSLETLRLSFSSNHLFVSLMTITGYQFWSLIILTGIHFIIETIQYIFPLVKRRNLISTFDFDFGVMQCSICIRVVSVISHQKKNLLPQTFVDIQIWMDWTLFQIRATMRNIFFIIDHRN